MAVTIEEKKSTVDTHLTRNQKTHFGTGVQKAKKSNLHIFVCQSHRLVGMSETKKTVRNARYIGGCVKIRKHHAHHRCLVYMGLGRRQGLCIMLGSFSCFRPGLTLCMHTIYARRKSFFQPPKGLLNSL